MRFLVRSWLFVLASFVLFHGCGNDGGGGVPSPEIFADPAVCDVPCEVLVDSGVETRAGDGLTFTWDVGDGPMEGDARLLHTFDAAGTHAITVTVSKGSASTTDTVTVLAEAQPKTSGDVDVSGGSVSHGPCTVTVPEGIAPESFPIELTELPSMQVAGARRLGEGLFTALGSAFEVGTPAKSAVAFDIAVRDAEAAGADVGELAWLARFISRPVPLPDATEPPPSLAPVASYVLAPVTRVDGDGTAHGDIYGRSRVQLVRLSKPLDIQSSSVDAALALKQSIGLLVVVSVHDPPTSLSKQQYVDAILEGVKRSHDFLVNQKSFLWLQPSVHVYVVKIANGAVAEVPRHSSNTILMGNALGSAAHVKKAIAHEFFHLIQNWHSNKATRNSTKEKDAWFAEGTACWAMDEVYNDTQAFYHATPTGRFQYPLVKEATRATAKDGYQTVAFWKWAETHNAEIVRAVLQDRFAKSHNIIGSSAIIENTVVSDYLSSFKALWHDVDFLEFAYASLYEKDYDKEETRPDELWSNAAPTPRLGPPKDVVPTFNVTLKAGAGDSEANAPNAAFKVQPHLSAELIEIQSEALEGKLHVRFPQGAEPLDARVFVIDKASKELRDSYTVRDLSKKRPDVTVSFDPDKLAMVLLVDPQWSYPSSTNPTTGKIKAWVENPCGPLPSNVIEVTPGEDLADVVGGAAGGAVVHLAPGNYTPPIKIWELPDGAGRWYAQLLLTDVTLAGSGEGQTRLIMQGDPFDAVGITTYGSVTIRDLTIEGGDFFGLSCLNPKNVTLCNVTIRTSGHDGITWSPAWTGGGSSSLSVYDSTITQVGDPQGTYGIGLSCYEEAGNVTAEISNSNFSGWLNGVNYYNYTNESCTVSVNTDCKGFSSNDNNVLELICPGEGQQCIATEQCP